MPLRHQAGYTISFATHFLARSANSPEGLYILLSVNSFFFSFLSFLIISWRQIISRSTGPIFAIFTSNESFLAVDDRSGPLYFDISRDVAMATNFGQKLGKINYPRHLSLCHSKTEWAIILRMSALVAPQIALHCVKMVKIGSVVFELNRERK